MTNYVLDTNVILEDCNVLKNLENATVNIPLIVLKEIDNNKIQMGEVGFNARSFSKILDGLNFSSYNDIIKYSDNLNIRFVTLPTANDLIPDDQIIEIAKNINNITNDVILLSNDINVRVKAKLAGLESKPYSKNNINKDDLYTGIRNIYTDSLIIDSLHSHGSLSMDLDGVSPNEYVHLVSNQNEKHTALAKLGLDNTLFKVKSVKSITGIKPKNLEQACAIDMILNNEIALATLMGNAGSGKTLIALASALYLVGSGQYQKLVIIRPPIPMGKDIGFLPGPQPLDAKIATPTGWSNMGDIKVGSQVINHAGIPVNVIGVYPKGYKDVYRVTTTDGTSTECCEDHLWYTQTFENKKRGKPGSVKSTKQIMETLWNFTGLSDKRRTKGCPNHYLPRNGPVAYEEQAQLPLSAYTLGALLGDGSIAKELSLANVDKDLIDKVNSELSVIGYKLKKGKGDSISYQIQPINKFANQKAARPVIITNTLTGSKTIYNTIGEALKHLQINRSTLSARCTKHKIVDGIQYEFGQRDSRWSNEIKNIIAGLGLNNKYSHTKFIPDIYKYASIENRLSLLRGLMDTDGTVKENGEASFTTTSKILADDVIELVRSLGGRATLCTRDRVGQVSYIADRKVTSRKVSYDFTISLPEAMNPFYIARKANRFSAKYMHNVGILSIEKIGQKEVQCIRVDDPEHLYLTDNFIVTHNTLEEKMMVWMGPILDNLEMLEDGNKKLDIEYLLNAGALEIAPPTFIRGRSIANSIVLVDEAQSLTIHEVKTIVTRIHSSSKLIFTGDIRQIDNNKLSMTDNGFSQLVQAFKDQPLSGHITLNKCERSSLAEIASQIL